MHGGVHPREVGAPHGPTVARDGVRKKQLLDHDISSINQTSSCYTIYLNVASSIRVHDTAD